MIKQSLFSDGVNAVLVTKWKLRLETPLCIKSNSSSAFNPTDGEKKTRNCNMSFGWNRSTTTNGDEVQVSDAHFGIHIKDRRILPCYSIPASCIRGSLRSWTIKHLVKKELWGLLYKLNENKENIHKIKEALESNPGLELAIDCFGMAVEEPDRIEDNISQAGRMKVEALPLENESEKPWVQGNDWKSGENQFGPKNVCRHISVRGPVDRITHAAREGGLHYFLEFSPNQTFDVILRVVNPDSVHLGLIALWEREINAGILRVGGLTSIGRGRLKVEKSQHDLFALPGYKGNWKVESAHEQQGQSDDILAQLWKTYPISEAGIYIEKVEKLSGL
jgi:hypothetical protein